MEGKESIEINKRRAEGTDDSKPKTLQLKTRKLNTSSTTCYVQGLEWIHKMRCLRFCCFWTSRGLYSMLERGCNASVLSTRLSYQKLITCFLLVFVQKPLVVFQVSSSEAFGEKTIDATIWRMESMLLTLAGMGDKGMTGKFDPTKAVALGLKAGPKYRELQLGNSVMSDHQSIMVHPSDVLGPSSPGLIVLLVGCSSLSHVEEMLSIQTLSDFYAENLEHHQEGMKCVNCVIHLGPTSVTMAPNYQKWMKRLGGAQHIMAGHKMQPSRMGWGNKLWRGTIA
ncbi:hypothetical protein MRB53_002729 [Persea americana]|uniref:Uncharacterized protein n=1 Tax=Persea americana TaxID=3435 RepID=A0ACC2MVB2_PERAE|nr:hypothetical protein MRB53_002729 [Persea americana]